MDQKQIKASLKEAKEAIKNKEIDKALRLCRQVLKVDGENYLGLVIMGAALQESKSKSEAPDAYRKAIRISPDQILAWQGLASYYEKEKLENFANELLSTYKQLISLEKDEAKLSELFKKIDSPIRCVKDTKVIEEFASLLSIDDVSKQAMVASSLSKYFKGLKDVPYSLLEICEKVVLMKLDGEQETDTIEYVQMYTKILSRRKDYKTVLAKRNQLLGVKNVPGGSILELICEAYCHLSFKRDECTDEINVREYYEPLLSIKENSLYGQIAKAVHLYNSADYIECRDVLTRVSEMDSPNWLVYVNLSEVNFRMLCFNDVLINVSNAEKAISKDITDEIKRRLTNLKLEALAKTGNVDHCRRCIEYCSSLPPEDQEKRFFQLCIMHAALALHDRAIAENNVAKTQPKLDAEKFNNFFQANSVDNSAEITLLRGRYLSSFTSDHEATTFLHNALRQAEEPEFAQCWILLGQLYWKQSKTGEALDSFLRAAKLAPYIYTSFLYLGHYYRTVANDLNKARRCYQKAFQLNPRCEEVGISLSDIYRELNLSDDNYRLLSSVTAAYGENWAWVRLGLHYLQVHNAEAAVQSLRSCVRNNPENGYCWELLGDACFARGSFTAALRCYQKCLDLNLSSLYPKLQLAIVKQRVGLHDESIQELRELAREHPDYIPALKGMAEACLSYVRELYEKQMLLTVRDLCEEAATALTKILIRKNGLTCAWKLLADACIWVCQLPARFSYLKLPSFLSDSEKEFDENDLEIFSQDSLVDFAVRFYETAIHLSAESVVTASSLWRDLGFSYNLKTNRVTVEDERIRLRRLAFSAAKKSISLCSKEWEGWNLLGVIALSKEISDAPLAQHCFIKALQFETNNALVWNNLGTMYLQLDDIHLANEAFQAAQKADPKYSRSWIGQALIAETVGHDETVDLLYHTTVLGYHPESAKAFAEWICKILKEWDTYKEKPHCFYVVEKMYGLQVATTVLSWYAVHHPDDIPAANMLAVLLELCNLNRTAVSVLESTVQRANTEESDIISSNLGRQLRKLGRYGKAIEHFKNIKQIDFAAQCEFALTLFLDGQYEESLSNYESAIHWLAPDDGWKAQVMVSVAALKYLKNEKKEAQAVLLECAGLKPVAMYGLFAACAFGILNKELMLTKLVLKELEAFKYDEEHCQHIALFNSYYQIFQGNFKAAINVMSTFVHYHPGNASLWLSLCCLLLQMIFLSKKDYLVHSLATAYFAKCSITLGRGLIDISKVSSIVSLSYLLSGRVEDSLRSSQKAVFAHPDVAENWAALIAVCSVRGKEKYSSLNSMIKFVREKLCCTKVLETWLSSLEDK